MILLQSIQGRCDSCNHNIDVMVITASNDRTKVPYLLHLCHDCLQTLAIMIRDNKEADDDE